MNIRIGIVGYGNLARGVEASVQLQPDMELIGDDDFSVNLYTCSFPFCILPLI